MNKAEESTRRRDEIVKKIRLIKNDEAEAKAHAILDKYLSDHKKNKTPERSFILSLIYKLSVPADIETIHGLVEKNYGHVSPTTVYYALQLFIEARLVRRIELIENGPSFYERTVDAIPHGYTVCRTCGAVKTFSLESIYGNISKFPATGFHIESVSLIINGTCRSCSRKLAKPSQKTKTTKKKI